MFKIYRNIQKVCDLHTDPVIAGSINYLNTEQTTHQAFNNMQTYIVSLH